MAGTTTTPAMLRAFTGQLPISGEQVSPSSMNSGRLNVVAEKACHLTSASGQVSDPKMFFQLCLSLSRGIDYAVTNNQGPETVQNLPLMLKQICQHRNDLVSQAAVMVLMISVKNACNVGWFSEKEMKELSILANQLGSSFRSPAEMNVEANHSLATISTIMTRFYPLMKLGHVLASLEVKPGYGTHVTDFSLSKQTAYSPDEHIRLFVAQTDNIETSTCIISPQLVNLLLNGQPVERRTNISMDPGPQLPTNVTRMLDYGSNLLQAVGQFNGHYIIVIAFMSIAPSVDTQCLEDYVQPAAASLDSDSDIIEGPSRISLNCPISYKRIKTPAKGLSCKHFQCFDFGNFIDINSRRPSWRCPHCNQSVCYTDIRVDQNMAKVLKEVGDNVDDVMISADGSWKAVMENDNNLDQAHTLDNKHQEPSNIQSSLPIVLDLSNDDDEMAIADTSETEDTKPFQSNLNSQSATPNSTMPSEINNSNGINQNVGAQVDDDFWSGLNLPNIHIPDAQIAGGNSQPLPPNSSATPPYTDVSANMSTSLGSVVTNEYGWPGRAPGQVIGTPVAPFQVPNLQQRSRVGVNFPIPNSSSLSSQTALPRSLMNGIQNRGNQEHPQIPGQPGQQASLPSYSQFLGAYRANSSSHLTDFHNAHLQQALNRRMPHQYTSQSPTMVGSSSHAPQTHIQQRGPVATGNTNTLHAIPGASRQIPRQPQTMPVHTAQTPRTGSDVLRVPQSVSSTIDLVNTATQVQNWRPTGRMRGSLQGSAYSAALNQFMTPNAQPGHSTRPSNLTSPLPNLPDLPSVLVSNGRHQPVRDPATMLGGSSNQPERPPGMH